MTHPSIIKKIRNFIYGNSEHKYSFEKHNTTRLNWISVLYKDYVSWVFIFLRLNRWQSTDDKALFLKRLGLKELDLTKQKELDNVIDQYAQQSFYNLFYYRARLIRENSLRYLYAFFTLLIVTLVPTIAFFYTDKAIGGLIPDNPLINKEQVDENAGKADSTSNNKSISINDLQSSNLNAPIIDRVVSFESHGTHTSPSFIYTAALQDSTSTGITIDEDPRIDNSAPPRGGGTLPQPATANTDPRNAAQNTTPKNPVNLNQETPIKMEELEDKKKGDSVASEKDSIAEEGTDMAANPEEELRGLEAIGIILTILITSLFAVHQLLSQWAGKRKFRSHFHQAKMDLMKIHFELENRGKTEFGIDPDAYDYASLILALKTATHECRTVVNQETKAYFDLSAAPAVDLGTIFSTSTASAQGIMSAFTSKRYTARVDRLKKEVDSQYQASSTLQMEYTTLKTKEKSAALQFKSLLDRQDRFERELADLDALNKEEDQDRKATLAARLLSLEEEIEKADFALEDARLKIELKEFEMNQYQTNV